MKTLILVLIFLSVSGVGFVIGDRYKQKEKFYYDFKNFLVYLKSEIGFFEKNVVDILNGYQTKNENLKLLFQKFNESLNGFEFNGLNILSSEENFKLIEFFKGIGKSDCESQKEYIEKNLEIFTKIYEDAKLDNQKKGNMFKKLSILAGLLICIVLI